MKRWLGRWIVAVSALHTLVALAVFRPQLSSIVERGFFNSLGEDVRLSVAAWYVLFGAVLFVLGLAIDALERHEGLAIPRSLGWSLLVLALVGVSLMPASGFWLALPPAIAILLRKGAGRSATAGTQPPEL
jgi:hypothetical protein